MYTMQMIIVIDCGPWVVENGYRMVKSNNLYTKYSLFIFVFVYITIHSGIIENRISINW